MINTAEINKLKSAIAAFDRADFGPSITEEFIDPTRAYNPPKYDPIRGQHPRLLLTKDDIESLRIAVQDEENAVAVSEFYALADTDTDGILPPAYLHETGRKGEHNYDYKMLAAIQAKALNYLITGDEYYGYSAIYAMLNFIRTLDVKWIAFDQCREFGYAMYIAACVYDWCHGLLTEEAKFLIIAGMEHKFLTGTTEDTVHPAYGGIKMEVGFPPTRCGTFTGHGSEMQILRDYLSFALAIYDEYPSWWKYVAARVYNEYVPVRNTYYRSKMVHQGTPSYATWRYLADMFSAWILKKATGENPYIDEMAQIVPSMIARETNNGYCLRIGDIYTENVGVQFNGCALITSYLYNDPTMRAFAKYNKHGFSTFGYGVAVVNPAETLILSSGGVETAVSRRSGLDTITYNPWPLGEIVSRNKWDSDDTAVVLTKIGERTTANHDHSDSGNFMIYYKGMLADDTGMYGYYGTPHHYYYHKSTIAHNSLLIYNPEHEDTEPQYNEAGKLTNAARYWYSGGQRVMGESPYLHTWMVPEYDTGKVTGAQYSYKADGKTPDYTYIGGEITQAYPANTVDYVGRKMLTVYTDDPKYPVLLFVADCIDAVSADFKKSFLLHVGSEPTINGNSAYYSNGEATLFLTNVTGNELNPSAVRA